MHLRTIKLSGRRWGVAFGTAAIAGTLLVAGCGGSSPTSGGNPSNAGYITRSTESAYSSDAKILAAQQTQTPLLPTDLTGIIDADLRAIRAQYPAVTDVHARSLYNPMEVIVHVAAGAPWLSNWSAGNVQTGEAAIDSLLQTYSVTGVRSLGASASGAQFVLTFAQSMNIPAFAAIFSGVSPNISAASPNFLAGDGDQITRETRTDGGVTYTFSRGFGDCPSGCIARHNWTVTLSPDRQIQSIVESGSPLPAQVPSA